MKRLVKKILFGVKGKVIFDELLSKHTTLRIGGPCKAWVEPKSEKDLAEIIKFSKINKIKTFVIGSGSNILVKDSGFKGIVICLKGPAFLKTKVSGKRIKTGAGVSLSAFVHSACRKGLGGVEGLSGIPGTVGGAIFMNASYKVNISESLEKIKVMDKKSARIKVLKKKNINFGYRQSGLGRYIILEAEFKLKKQKKDVLLSLRESLMEDKRKRQPLGLCSPGCVFKNPSRSVSAGRYIEMAGLKGKKIGGAMISEKHANFIINAKNAKAKDVFALIKLIKKTVKFRFNIDLVPEALII